MSGTQYSQIVDTDNIGKLNNTIEKDSIIKLANKVQLDEESNDKNLLLLIDMQNDFMEGGALGVPGSLGDVDRVCQFILKNISQIYDIAASLDTHSPLQIFHPSYWVDKDGNNPPPYTLIENLDTYKPKDYRNIKIARDYINKLKSEGKRTLCIWSEHCLKGTSGHSLETQLSNMLLYYSVARNKNVRYIEKGYNTEYEMYGIFFDEMGVCLNQESSLLLFDLTKYNKIIIAGEAKSHCCLETIEQIIASSDESVASRIYVLNDCMSSIPGFEEDTDKRFEILSMEHEINLINSTNLVL